MSRRLVPVLVLAVLALGVSSLAQRSGGVLRAGMQTDPVGLDPHLTNATATRNMMENLFETLVAFDKSGQIIPRIAESWTVSSDNLTWTFRIRQGIRFHNGRALVADDVVYSINRIRDPETRSPRAADFATIQSISAPNPSTVVIQLEAPFAPLLGKLAFSTNGIVPREVASQTDGLNRTPVGTGPFRFVEYIPQTRLVLRKFADYWDRDAQGNRRPYLDEIVFLFFPDPTARTTALRTGAVDWIEYVPAQDVNTLRSDPNVVVTDGTAANFRGVYLNMNFPPLADQRVRQAIAYALDAEEVVDIALFGTGGTVAKGVTIPEGNFYFYPSPYGTTSNLERARQLMRESGYPNGFEVTLKVTSTYDFLRLPAEIIQAQLQPLNIRVRIVAEDWTVYLPGVLEKNYEMTFLGTSGQSDPDDFLWGNFHTTGGLNLFNLSDPQVDRFLEQGRAESDPARRKQVYDQAQARILELMPVAMLFHSAQYEAHRTYVRGYDHWFNTSYLGFRTTWLDR